MKFLFRIFVLSVLVCACKSLKVLGVFPVNIKSHFRVFQAVMRGLAAKGHDVTVVSHYPQDKPIPRYRDVSLKGIFPLFVETVDVENLYNYNKIDMFMAPTEMSQWAQGVCESAYFSERFNAIWNSSTTYDVMVVEMFNTDCFLPISAKLNVPVVALSSSTFLPWVTFRFGIPLNPSYMQNIFMGYPKNLDFWQRFENSVITWIQVLFHRMWRNKRDDAIVRKYFNEILPPVRDLAKNVSLIMVNTHYSLHDAKPFPPNVIEIGGIHLKPRKKLEKVMKQEYSLLTQI